MSTQSEEDLGRIDIALTLERISGSLERIANTLEAFVGRPWPPLVTRGGVDVMPPPPTFISGQFKRRPGDIFPTATPQEKSDGGQGDDAA